MMRRRSQARSRGRAGRQIHRPSGWVLGWAAAAVVLVGLAVVVGRPAAEQELLGGSGPSPSAATPRPIAFGATIDQASGRVVGRTGRFGPGDGFAYAASFPEPLAAGSVLVEVVRLDDGGSAVVQPPLAQDVFATGDAVAVELPAERLIAAWGAGSYEMRMYLAADGPVVAIGRFRLLADARD